MDVSKRRLHFLWIAVGAVIALGCSPSQQNASARNDAKPAAAEFTAVVVVFIVATVDGRRDLPKI
jgi:hypothetical protein